MGWMTFKIGMSNRMIGVVDFCDGDFLSRLELEHMAIEFSIYTEGCNFWFCASRSGVRAIKNDSDVIRMSSNVGQ